MKNWLIIVSFCGWLMVLFSCNTPADSEENESIQEKMVSIPNISETPENTVFYKGNPIKINGNEREVLMEEIQLKKQDLYMTAKRVSIKQYLLNKGLSAEEIEKEEQELIGEQLFYFEIEEERKQDFFKTYFKDNYTASVQYFSFDLFQDFELVNESGDTLPANYSIYERAYHVAPFERVILSFSNVNSGEELELIYKDKLFNKGEVKFHFPNQNDIKSNIQSAL